MNITIAYYYFNDNRVSFLTKKIEKETDKCYFADRRRYSKDEIGIPLIKYVSSYPYIELVMIDADENDLRDGLAKWFNDRAYQIWRIRD